MRRVVMNKVKMVIVALSLLVVIAGLLGCSTAKAAADQSVTTPTPGATAKASAINSSNSSISPTPNTASQNIPKTTPTATPKPTPNLTSVSFTLTLDEGQEYIENTTPIYLRASQTLHLDWSVVKGGDHFYMTFTLPSGNLIAIRSDGSLTNCSPGETAREKLTENGDLVFCPENNNWGDGYYIFHPQIHKDDPSVQVKLLYWID